MTITVLEAIAEATAQKKRKVTLEEFGKALCVSKQYIGQIKNKNLSPQQISQIENNLQINLTDVNKKGNSEHFTLDYYPDIFGSCGNGVFELSPQKEQIQVPLNALFKQLSKGKQYSVINARGNSMEPLIFDNDKLIIEHYNGEQIVDNRPYIFCYKDEIFIKRLAKNVDQLMIISENKDYDIRKLTGNQLKDVNIIGQIVGLMRELK